MRSRRFVRVVFAGIVALASSLAAAQSSIRFSEIHYDNAGTDSGEAIELSGPAGTDLAGWQVLLYNGSNGAVYDTKLLSGTIPASCGTRGVVVINYPANGIQNGSPDAMALIDASGAVIEFLSYEGVMAGVGGPADGLTATDMGVLENGTGPVGESLQRAPNGSWNSSGPNSFGACNDDGGAPPATVASVTVTPSSATLNVGATLTMSATAFDIGGQPVAGTTFTWTSSQPAVATVSGAGVVSAIGAGDALISATASNGVANSSAVHVNAGPPPSTSPVHFNEIHYDNVGTDTGEAIEVEGPAGTDLTGYSIVLYNGNGGVPYSTQTLSGVLPASCGTRGVVFVSYPQDGIQNGAPDGMALIDGTGAVVEFLSYEGTFAASSGPAAGMNSIDIQASQTNAALGQSLQRNSSGVWQSGASSFGACNAEAPPQGGNAVTFTGRNGSDPALPVGFQDQLFGRLADANNTTLPTTFTWVSETPATASIDQNGVFTALAAGSATLRATAADGTTATITLPNRIAVASTTAQYAGNTEFGEPTDADPSDDFLVRYPQYTASYNPNRGTPNWVSYDLDATHFGTEDRCDCFTMDPALPASFPQLSTADYTDAGTFAGYGIDRGHMTRSFDRTSASLDNAYTYLFDNVVPQASDLNQGPWAIFENFLGDQARFSNMEVYIIAGVAGNKGTLKNQGRIVIPTSTWKVAVIVPRDTGLAQIHDYRDLQVIAVNMPNEPGVRNVDWHSYITTVDQVEALSGYDLLAALPDDIENAVESGTQPPIAAIGGPSSLFEGDTANFTAAASVDPNGSITSYLWDFGDGSTGTGVSVVHTFAQDGVHVVSLLTTDNDGLIDTVMFPVTVANVAPVIGAIPDASVNAGAAYTVAGSFADPGADSWIATVDWGDGTAPSQAALSGHQFSLVHLYPTAGTFTVTVTIADDDASSSVASKVTVVAPGAVLVPAIGLIDQLVAGGTISRSLGSVLRAELTAAQDLLNHGKTAAAAVVLKATVAELDVLVRLRVLSTGDAAPLRNALVQITGSLRT